MTSHAPLQSAQARGNPGGGDFLLQRKCACGGSAGRSGECTKCREEKTQGLQARLAMGASHDHLEQEADNAAAQVMRSGHAEIRANASPPRLSRRSHADGGARDAVPSSVQRTLASSGAPLPETARSFFEPRFGHDFANVQIHRNAQAARSAAEVDAHAYTVGRHIVFGQGRYAPDTSSGRELLAHELAHVVQQGADGPRSRLQRRAIHSGNILFEGTCEFLACNSRWACEDENGVTCPEGTRNAHAETGKKYRPLFTCDTNCENNQSCSDSGNWMAIPRERFTRRKCGQDLVICANGHSTHASVRDRSVGEHWEVSPGITDSLGVARGTFTGSIYGSESDAEFLRDSRCRSDDSDSEGGGSNDGGGGGETEGGADTPSKDAGAKQEAGAGEETGGSTGSGARRVFALTFDDGPHSAALGGGANRTENVLDALQSKGAKAGFFIQAHALSGEGRPLRGDTPSGRALIRRMRADGHAIGIHTGGTRDHEAHTAAQAAGRLRGELESARTFIRDTTASDDQAGLETTLVRPPFGRSNEAVRQTYADLGLTNLLWDIDGDPGGEMSLDELKAQVGSGIRRIAGNRWRVTTPSAPKIVVLYHDIRRGTSTHIGAVIEHIKQVTQDVDGSTAAFERP